MTHDDAAAALLDADVASAHELADFAVIDEQALILAGLDQADP